MEVILAKSSGFCFGVKRAVDKVYEQTDKNKKIYQKLYGMQGARVARLFF